jgi:putative transposase
MFPELRDYKAMEAGVEIMTGNPANTSQAGSGCGFLVPKSLNVRTHRYLECGLVLDRDLNTAGNILSAGTGRSGTNVDGCIMRSPRSSPL